MIKKVTKRQQVWIIDDDHAIRWVLEKALKKVDITTRIFENGKNILSLLEQEQPMVIISDIRMPGIDGLDLLQQLQQEYTHIPVIIMTAHSDLESAVSAYEGGAFEYLPKPFDIDNAIELVQRAIVFSQEQQEIKEQNQTVEITPEIIGKAASMQEVFRAIGRLSRSNITVLINGESGTGKELVAKALHRHSPREHAPFVALNMAAIPQDLLESELFGHEKGAFTGAQIQRQGRFEQANNGTLFLDEIGDMPAEMQTRLLRVLSDGEFYRIGGHASVKVNVRIIAATHQNLEKRVEEGLFREDLYHRLNVIRIHIPPLRERREDIVLLAEYFLAQAAKELEVDQKLLDKESKKILTSLPWLGNVRQLENICHWFTVMSPGKEIHPEDMPAELLNKDVLSKTNTLDNWETALQLWIENSFKNGQQGILDQALPRFEKIMIETALQHTQGRKREAAILLGWGRNTLTRKIKELNMNKIAQPPLS